MNYSSKHWRMVIRFSDVAGAFVILFIAVLVVQHSVRFKALIFPMESVLFLVPWPVLRAVAVKEKKKCEAREARAELSV